MPRALLAGWVEGVANVNPFTPMLEAGRDFISGSPASAGRPTRSPRRWSSFSAGGRWEELRNAEAAGGA